MHGFEKSTNFLISFIIYGLASLLVIRAGAGAIEYAGNLKFYHRFVLKWEQSLIHYHAGDAMPPAFSGSNHAPYMDALIQQFHSHGITAPASNTDKAYIYRLARFWPDKNEDIFLLGLDRKIILFGLSKTTFDMLDKKIDKTRDKKNGKFTGKKYKNSPFHTGIWTL